MKIEPCPFCGETDDLEARDEVSWNVHCGACGAVGPGGPNNEELAIQLWNHRK